MEKLKSKGLLKFLLFVGICMEIHLANCAKPWEPEAVTAKPFWMIMHEIHLNYTKQNFAINKIHVLFLGDSMTQLWWYDCYGKSTWNKEYAPIGAVNYGIGGDKTQNLLWRIENGQLDKLVNPPPKLVVLCIGGNNLFDVVSGNSTVEQIVKGIEKIVKTLREKLPQTKILLLGIFPGFNAWAFEKISNINLQIARLDSETYGRSVNGSVAVGYGKMLKYFEMWTHFALSWGQVVPELYSKDLVHLNPDGYAKWAEVMNSTFIEMLN